ncbi:hypothetical protein RFI_04135 [Reticulomyxa filosa]|uniref:Uncharacterized protein n=1 Tax=Reticulomyxa filosa TaxID=46433 RepID=X6P5T3_RETFI|nr:hypothetical protein RFI_04135 [Reticulomyxa filosa]|eukprot:ETO32972.1 hypothetical protein RFI_04135 [Reticulomyxa filosa]
MIAFGVVHSSLTVADRSLYLSIFAAVTNMVFQSVRMILEARTVHETWIEYMLNCVMARVDWTPYLHEIDEVRLKAQFRGTDKIHKIDYNEMGVWKLCAWFGSTMDYDFSEISIEFNFCNMHIYKYMYTYIKLAASVLLLDQGTSQEWMEIHMSKACGLVGVHALIQLLQACKKRVVLKDIDDPGKFPWQSCINLTAKQGRDIRIGAYAYMISNAQPLLIALLNSGFDPEGRIFRLLLRNGTYTYTYMYMWFFFFFNLNISEIKTTTTTTTTTTTDIDPNLLDENGQSVVFHLVEQMNHKGLEKLFEISKKKKRRVFLNFTDRNGFTPLYYALQVHQQERLRFHKRQQQARYEQRPVIDTPDTDTNVNLPSGRVAVDLLVPHSRSLSLTSRRSSTTMMSNKPEVSSWIYEILLKNAADPNVMCHDRSPLSFALQEREREVDRNFCVPKQTKKENMCIYTYIYIYIYVYNNNN